MQEEANWIAAAASGNRAAQRHLIERYQGPVLRFARNLLRDHQEAEDVTQEVLVSALGALDGFDARRARFLTWLFTLARNRCLNRLRRPNRRAQGDPALREAGSRAEAGGRGGEVMDHLRQCLEEAFQELPDVQRTAFLLAEVEGLTYPEVAAVEGVPVGTVKSRIHRARERLQQLLRGVEEDA
jgi:RNA polymerase sigma-70 factor (ECF subfamily)